ncbi:MAG: hypothetical protein ACLP50_13320 [Solirubrobacteraceae bacterium]
MAFFGLRQRRLRAQIMELDDAQLVDAASDEFWGTMGSDESIDPLVRLKILTELKDAQGTLGDRVILSDEGRGRLRSFLLNTRLRMHGSERSANTRGSNQ